MALDEASKSEGLERIRRAEALLEVALSAEKDADGVLDLTALENGDEIVAGATDAAMRKRILRALGVITVTRGQGGPATLTNNPRAAAASVAKLSRELWGELSSSGTLPREAIARRRVEAGAEEAVDGAVWLLKELLLAAGVQRAGGLRLYGDFLKDLQAAEEEIEKLREGDAEREEKEAEEEASHEKVYYDPAAAALIDLGFSASVVGVRHRAAGAWNTPDVIGFYVHRSRSIVVPVVRVATVEVKHSLTRHAIAEAESHKRLGHFSYVCVPSPFLELPKDLVTECVEKGLGIICPRRKGQQFIVHIDAPLHRPDEEDVDLMLSNFTDDQGVALSERVSREVRTAFTTLFA